MQDIGPARRYLEILLDQALEQRASKKPKSRVWSFLNSAFGLFLLSSVLLGSLSFAYGQFGRYLERRRTADKLELEIGLRFKELKKLTEDSDANRYSQVVNIGRVNEGDTSKFYLRKPVFSEFERKRTSSLLWQLSLVVHGGERQQVLATVKDVLHLDELIVRIRNNAPRDLPERPKGKTEKEEDRLADIEDIFRKDYGQKELYQLIGRIVHMSIWTKSE